MKVWIVALTLLVVLALAMGWLVWRPARVGPDAALTPGPPAPDRPRFLSRPIGDPPEGTPWITDLVLVDLDQDGLTDVVVADAQRNRIGWIRQTRPGVFEEQMIGSGVAAPAQVSVVDLDEDGHLDVLVSSMGVIPPSNARSGAVVVLMNDGAQRFTNRVLLQDTARVSSVEAADLNGDGRRDLVVGQFGFLQGEIRWMENLGEGQFRSHSLSDLPGTIHTPVVDLNGDGHLDVVALVSQDTEEVQAFLGDGRGGFRPHVIHGSTNKDYGSSGLCVADVNQDGRPDVVYTNGDGFDYATPGSRPWHGVQWLENLGDMKFAYHRIGDFPGCYSPAVADIDGDGDPDIIASSAFNDWERPEAVSLMWFENDGNARFTARPLAQQPTHLVVVQAGNLLRRGRTALVTGALLFYPPYRQISRVTLWEQQP
ncbi:MAG TPA: VCBS repeat-containing protein [Lacunisphaera sp.]|nr:VCBS repeat-containing protein [Lacunisphaera sp.]